MTEKRYAIVRVDGICPPEKMFCSERKIGCKKCLYGDTKEQLIRKVTQAIKIGFEKKDFVKYGTLAKFVVEFLGVEE